MYQETKLLFKQTKPNLSAKKIFAINLKDKDQKKKRTKKKK